MSQLQQLLNLQEEAADLRRQLREREKADLLKSIAEREAAAAAATAKQRAADQLARDAEIESTRKGSWMMYLTGPEKVKELEAHAFSPAWIESSTPASGWPPGVDSSDYTYSAVADPIPVEDGGAEVPPLVLAARANGIPV